MSDYTHRDRRAHRDVGRAFWAVTAVALALTGLALGVPLPFAGIAAVVALGALGAAYVGWSERMLADYANDLRLAREGGATGGFVRAEAAMPVGLYRDVGGPTSPSPHTRRRTVDTRRDENDPRSGPGRSPITSDSGPRAPPGGGP